MRHATYKGSFLRYNIGLHHMEASPSFNEDFWTAILDHDSTQDTFSCDSLATTPCVNLGNAKSSVEGHQSLTELDSLFLDYANGTYAGWDGFSPDHEAAALQSDSTQHPAILIPLESDSEPALTPCASSAASTSSGEWCYS